MAILLATHSRFADHDTGRSHPERPARLAAVLDGIGLAGLGEAVTRFEPRPATHAEVERVHLGTYLSRLEQFCTAGGGPVDPDTITSTDSFDAAMLAAGAGLDAVERLDAGEGDAAFCVVRPPGHHATATRAMGFCLLNNVAVSARMLADRGERVLIVDYDAHHGNGTQEVFFSDPDVAYVSFHEYPLYPGTGRIEEIGEGAGRGTTINFPVPAGATGDVYRAGIDEVIVPFVESFAPSWLIISAGFDSHRRDPLGGLGLASGDFADLTAELVSLVPAGRRLCYLEGGYDLEALRDSAGAVCAALVGERFRPEAATSGGPGHPVIEAVRHRRLAAELS